MPPALGALSSPSVVVFVAVGFSSFALGFSIGVTVTGFPTFSPTTRLSGSTTPSCSPFG